MVVLKGLDITNIWSSLPQLINGT